MKSDMVWYMSLILLSDTYTSTINIKIRQRCGPHNKAIDRNTLLPSHDFCHLLPHLFMFLGKQSDQGLFA